MHTPELRAGIGGLTPDHVRHRLSVRRHGLDDGERSRGPDPLRQAHPRGDARHPDRGQVDAAADGQQRADARSARGRRVRAGEVARRLDAVGVEDVTASRRSIRAASRRGSGARTRTSCTSRSRATRSITAAQIVDAARAHRRRARTAASDAPASEQPRRAWQRQLDDRDDERAAGASRAPRAPAVPRLRRPGLEHDAVRARPRSPRSS